MENREVINDVLVHLFNEIMELEEQAIITEEYKKGYTTRERSEQDRRVVFIHLTLKGRKAYHHHAEFHRKMTDAVLEVLDEKEALVLAKALDSLALFFRQYKA